MPHLPDTPIEKIADINVLGTSKQEVIVLTLNIYNYQDQVQTVPQIPYDEDEEEKKIQDENKNGKQKKDEKVEESPELQENKKKKEKEQVEKKESHSKANQLKVLYKKGDDLRKDQVVMQVFRSLEYYQL